MSSDPTKHPSNEELRAQRMLPAQDVIEYAKVVIENPEVVQLIREEINNKYMNEDDTERVAGRLYELAEEYQRERGQPLQKAAALIAAHSLILLKLRGDTEDFESDKCLQVLKGAEYVDFSEEK